MRRILIPSYLLVAGLWLPGCGTAGPSGPPDSTARFSESGTTSTIEFSRGKVAPLSPGEGVTDRSPAMPATESITRDSPGSTSPEPSARHFRAEARESTGRRAGGSDRHVQSGTLTAGSFDDNERFDDFRQFVSLAMQQDPGENLPRLVVDDRILITVQNDLGEPVGDARVVIRAARGQSRSAFDQGARDSILFDCMTGSDGRALFLPNLAGAGGFREFSITVIPPGANTGISHVCRSDQRPWQFSLQDSAAPLPNRLDLALVIDTTGSMGDELEYLKVEVDSIAAAVHEMFPNVDQRYALIVYRDKGDQYVTRTFDFTGSLGEFRSRLAAQVATGGGDYPEAMHTALEQAGRLSWRNRDTARVLFLVGDAPPHDEFLRQTLDAVTTLRNKNVHVYPVAASGADLKCEFVMRAAAFLTLGQHIFLTDHSGVGNPHAEPHVPSYEVEHLNKLMIRMIASELSGKRLLPRDILAQGGAVLQGRHGMQSGTAPPSFRIGEARSHTISWPPGWALLAVTFLCWCVLESIVERWVAAQLTNRRS